MRYLVLCGYSLKNSPLRATVYPIKRYAFLSSERLPGIGEYITEGGNTYRVAKVCPSVEHVFDDELKDFHTYYYYLVEPKVLESVEEIQEKRSTLEKMFGKRRSTYTSVSFPDEIRERFEEYVEWVVNRPAPVVEVKAKKVKKK